MSTRSSMAIAAIAAGTMLALSLTPASAFMLSGPSLARPVASAQIDNVWWRGGGCGWGRCGGWGHRWGGWGYRGWGYHSYYGGWGRHCWRGVYGHLHCY
jgi:hypothetical protein